MVLVYLSGRYSGHIHLNIRRARKVAAKLWDEGYAVLCPHCDTANFEKWCKATAYDDFIRGDLRMIDGVDAVVMLQGWEKSKGANIEKGYAEKIGKPVYIYPDLPPVDPPKRSILETAQGLIHGARNKDYGHPIDDFTRTGRMWGAFLGLPDIPPESVSMMMCLLKISRLSNTPTHRDSLVDLAGYAGTDEMVIEERKRREDGIGEGRPIPAVDNPGAPG